MHSLNWDAVCVAGRVHVLRCRTDETFTCLKHKSHAPVACCFCRFVQNNQCRLNQQCNDNKVLCFTCISSSLLLITVVCVCVCGVCVCERESVCVCVVCVCVCVRVRVCVCGGVCGVCVCV